MRFLAALDQQDVSNPILRSNRASIADEAGGSILSPVILSSTSANIDAIVDGFSRPSPQ
jgi:hypothetical protein